MLTKHQVIKSHQNKGDLSKKFKKFMSLVPVDQFEKFLVSCDPEVIGGRPSVIRFVRINNSSLTLL